MLTKNIQLMIDETLKHYNADTAVQGEYWNPKNKSGSFIGCLTHGNSAGAVTEKFNVEITLVRLIENIFDNLKETEAKEFFKKIPLGIGGDGKDLSQVKSEFLGDLIKALPESKEENQNIINLVIRSACYDAATDAARYARSASDDPAAECRRQAYSIFELIREAPLGD